MTPPQRALITYADAAASTVPLPKAACSSCTYSFVNSSIFDAVPFYSTFKSIPVPKLLVPTGLDEQGLPSAVLFWGRAVPPERIDNATFAKTFDLDFLYQARSLVGLIEMDPELQRKPARLVADLFDDSGDPLTEDVVLV